MQERAVFTIGLRCSGLVKYTMLDKLLSDVLQIRLGRVTGASKVAWITCTTPKEEGGLGLKNWVVWNTVCALKLIWLLFFKSNSILASWIITEVLDGDIGRFWVINTKQKHSWLANHLLSLRDTIFPWMKIAVGNGETTYFWTSNWSPFGNIRNYLQGEGPRHFGIPPMTTLAELWKDDNWNLPPALSKRQVNIQTFLTTISLSHARDEYSWEPNIIYFSWSERNSRIHRSTFRQVSAIKKDINKVIRLKIAAIRLKDPSLSSAMYQAWIS
ncbi:hypothetical protein HID58_082080 [Brassica napus]|uniref:Reverse transcriptase zinc-binding domain-containing protein n=1 Tax=Brassica napus TaxID=3708 RepID=A0ABQ7YAY4_BRANA|nr:hypothetical protein HID58_082080 [Brassica napus]